MIVVTVSVGESISWLLARVTEVVISLAEVSMFAVSGNAGGKRQYFPTA